MGIFRSLAPSWTREGEVDSYLAQEVVINAKSRIGSGPAGWALHAAAENTEVVAQYFDTVPDLPVAAIGASIEALLIDMISDVLAPNEQLLGPSAVPPMAAAAAQRDVPFEDIMEQIRVLERDIFSRLVDASPKALKETLSSELAMLVSKMFDGHVNRFVVAYMRERDFLMDSVLARRRTIIDSIIDEQDYTPGQIREDLGVEIERFHIGFVLCRPGTYGSDLEHVFEDMTAHLSNASSLVIRIGHDQLWAWLSTSSEPKRQDLERLSLPPGTPDGLRCAIGELAAGQRGFRRSHLQARAIDTFEAQAQRAEARLVRWVDRSLVALLGADIEKASWFVKTTLGPLATDSEGASEQRATLWAYLRTGRSLLRAAEQSHVHRNTVVYRLNRIEKILGRSLADACADLEIALMLVDSAGPVVLDAQ